MFFEKAIPIVLFFCSKNLCLMHFNVRSIQKNMDELANLLTQLKTLSDVRAITETKPKRDQLYTNINSEDYTFIHNDTEKNSGWWVFTKKIS